MTPSIWSSSDPSSSSSIPESPQLFSQKKSWVSPSKSPQKAAVGSSSPSSSNSRKRTRDTDSPNTAKNPHDSKAAHTGISRRLFNKLTYPQLIQEQNWDVRTQLVSDRNGLLDQHVYPLLAESEGALLVDATRAARTDFFQAIAKRLSEPDYYKLMSLRPGPTSDQEPLPLFHRIVTQCVPEICQAIADNCQQASLQALCDLQVPCNLGPHNHLSGQTVFHHLMSETRPTLRWKQTCVKLISWLTTTQLLRHFDQRDLYCRTPLLLARELLNSKYTLEGEVAKKGMIIALINALGLKHLTEPKSEVASIVVKAFEDNPLKYWREFLFGDEKRQELRQLILSQPGGTSRMQKLLGPLQCPIVVLTETLPLEDHSEAWQLRDDTGTSFLHRAVIQRYSHAVLFLAKHLTNECFQGLLLQNNPPSGSALRALLGIYDEELVHSLVREVPSVMLAALQAIDPFTQLPYLFSVPEKQVIPFLASFENKSSPEMLQMLSIPDRHGRTLLGRLLPQDSQIHYRHISSLLDPLDVNELIEWLRVSRVGNKNGWEFVVSDLSARLSNWTATEPSTTFTSTPAHWIILKQNPGILALLLYCEMQPKLEALLDQQVKMDDQAAQRLLPYLVQQCEAHQLGRLLGAFAASKEHKLTALLHDVVSQDMTCETPRVLQCLANNGWIALCVRYLSTSLPNALNMIERQPNLLQSLGQDAKPLFDSQDLEGRSLLQLAFAHGRTEAITRILVHLQDEELSHYLLSPNLHGRTAWQELVDHRAGGQYFQLLITRSQNFVFNYLEYSEDGVLSVFYNIILASNWSRRQYKAFFSHLDQADSARFKTLIGRRDHLNRNVFLMTIRNCKPVLLDTLSEVNAKTAYHCLQSSTSAGVTPFGAAVLEKIWTDAVLYLTCIQRFYGLSSQPLQIREAIVLEERERLLEWIRTQATIQISQGKLTIKQAVADMVVLLLPNESVTDFLQPLVAQLSRRVQPRDPAQFLQNFRIQAEESISNTALSLLFEINPSHYLERIVRQHQRKREEGPVDLSPLVELFQQVNCSDAAQPDFYDPRSETEKSTVSLEQLRQDFAAKIERLIKEKQEFLKGEKQQYTSLMESLRPILRHLQQLHKAVSADIDANEKTTRLRQRNRWLVDLGLAFCSPENGWVNRVIHLHLIVFLDLLNEVNFSRPAGMAYHDPTRLRDLNDATIEVAELKAKSAEKLQITIPGRQEALATPRTGDSEGINRLYDRLGSDLKDILSHLLDIQDTILQTGINDRKRETLLLERDRWSIELARAFSACGTAWLQQAIQTVDIIFSPSDNDALEALAPKQRLLSHFYGRRKRILENELPHASDMHYRNEYYRLFGRSHGVDLDGVMSGPDHLPPNISAHTIEWFSAQCDVYHTAAHMSLMVNGDENGHKEIPLDLLDAWLNDMARSALPIEKRTAEGEELLVRRTKQNYFDESGNVKFYYLARILEQYGILKRVR